MNFNRFTCKFIAIGLAAVLVVALPVRGMADEPIEEVTPVPGATNLIAPRAPEQSTAPIKITKIWTTTVSGRCIDGFSLMGRWVCTQFQQFPFVHWNFENADEKVATAIRFEVDETSAFGEVEGAQTSDLTGKFSPHVKIESRASYNRAFHGEGTHWEVRVLKVLWNDGSVWERGAPLSEPSNFPSPGPTSSPASSPNVLPSQAPKKLPISSTTAIPPSPKALSSDDEEKADWQTFTLNI